MTRMPSLAGERVQDEAKALGCYYTDYLAYIVCHRVGIPMDVPLGEVTDHPTPPEATGGRVQFIAKVPKAAADLVKADAEHQGISLSDYIAKAVCDHLDIPFEPRIKGKALAARAKAEELRMTG